MAGVQTDAQAARLCDQLQNSRQVFEAMSQCRPLAGSQFQQYADAIPLAAAMHLIQRSSDSLQSSVLARTHMRARMCDQIPGPNPLGALQFDNERLDGPAIEDLIGRRQIDEVRIMNDGKP